MRGKRVCPPRPKLSHNEPRHLSAAERVRANGRRRAAGDGRGPGVAWRLALLTVAAVVPLGCTPRARWWDSCTGTPAAPVAARVDATEHLVVYLDASKGMKGFVSARAGERGATVRTIFTRALLELAGVGGALVPRPALVLRVLNTKMQPPASEPASELRQYAADRGRFRGGRGSLAAVFKTFEEPVGQSAGARPARYHILLTDGVQADGTDPRCVNDSDTQCAREKINELLNKGWGATVLGVRGEFDGLVFSHVGGRRAVRHRSEPARTETFRPFYLYVFSPDQAALSEFVLTLKKCLRRLLTSPGQLREYALSAPYVTEASGGDFVGVGDETGTVARESDAPAGASCFNLRVAPQGQGDDAEGGTLNFKTRVTWSHHGLDSGTPQEVAGLVKWELTPVDSTPQEGMPYPQMKIVGSTVDGDGTVTLQLAARRAEGAGTRQARIYQLIGRLDLEKTAPPWVAAWSTATDTTAEEAPRTLNLKVSLANLWNNKSLRDQELASACLRVVE